MLKALKYIALLLFAAIAGVLIYAATKPDDFAVSRSANIKAPAEKIFPLIDDMRTMNAWNPFAKMDPTIKISYRGPQAGKGAAYDWEGTGQTGQGSMIVTNSTPSSRVDLDLHFTRPFEANNRVAFTLEPRGDETRVTWTMSGPMPYLNKVMTTLFDMDKMVGGEFEKGLADLKSQAEK
jgi:hypothetical protein